MSFVLLFLHLSCVVFFVQVRTTALAFLKRMYEKDHLRDYIEKFALNYMQLLVHPNPPSLLFGADKDTGEGRPLIIKTSWITSAM